jgi:hypothetical protein
MRNGIILEIAVVNMFGAGALQLLAYPPPRPADHYWRIRWVEDGEQVDSIAQIDSLTTMAHHARDFMAGGEAVAWRYYETGV